MIADNTLDIRVCINASGKMTAFIKGYDSV